METHSSKFKVRLGMFVAGGILIFAIAIFLIGRQKNLFNPVFNLNTTFYNVSGMQVGNNVRFSGINVGTVENMRIINDSTVQVEMIIQKEIQKFIKADCQATIGSEGLIGDRVLIITQGSSGAETASDGQTLSSIEPVETDEIIASLYLTAQNAEIISSELAEIMLSINGGEGTLGRLIQDTTIAENINRTIINLRSSSKGLDQNMEAAKQNFLLRGFFKKKEREAAKALKLQEEKKAVDVKKK
ncbi:MAG TPA: MCE family protein [Prolixibacteraceae bacterium]|nr:MCE family protein [Prolixibacteraceae bacterium]